MKIHLLLALGASLAPAALVPSAPAEIAFAVEEGTALTKSSRLRLEMDLEELSIELNGEQLEFPVPEARLRIEQTIVLTDVYESMDEEDAGRVLVLRRTYDELSERNVVESEVEEMAEDTEHACPLEGETIVMTWDPEAEEYRVEAEDEELDQELYEHLDVDSDLRWLLPAGEVEEGETWELGDEELQRLMEDLGGNLPFEDDEERDEDDPIELAEDDLGGTFVCTFGGIQEEGDLRLALIRFEAEGEGEGEGEVEEEGGTGTQTVRIGCDLEGELLWDLEGGHFHRFELGGRLELGMVSEGEGEYGGETMSGRTEMVHAGDVALEITVERS